MRGNASACIDMPVACADPNSCPLPLMPCIHRHPDKNANSTESTEMFQKINAACEVLKCILACIAWLTEVTGSPAAAAASSSPKHSSSGI